MTDQEYDDTFFNCCTMLCLTCVDSFCGVCFPVFDTKTAVVGWGTGWAYTSLRDAGRLSPNVVGSRYTMNRPFDSRCNAAMAQLFVDLAFLCVPAWLPCHDELCYDDPCGQAVACMFVPLGIVTSIAISPITCPMYFCCDRYPTLYNAHDHLKNLEEEQHLQQRLDAARETLWAIGVLRYGESIPSETRPAAPAETTNETIPSETIAAVPAETTNEMIPSETVAAVPAEENDETNRPETRPAAILNEMHDETPDTVIGDLGTIVEHRPFWQVRRDNDLILRRMIVHPMPSAPPASGVLGGWTQSTAAIEEIDIAPAYNDPNDPPPPPYALSTDV